MSRVNACAGGIESLRRYFSAGNLAGGNKMAPPPVEAIVLAIGQLPKYRDSLTQYGTSLSTLCSQIDTYAITTDVEEIQNLDKDDEREGLKYMLLSIRVVLKAVLDAAQAVRTLPGFPGSLPGLLKDVANEPQVLKIMLQEGGLMSTAARLAKAEKSSEVIYASVSKVLTEAHSVTKDQSYGLQLLSAIPHVGKFFTSSDVTYFCDSVDVTDIMEDFRHLENLPSESPEETLKVILLRYHLALSFGVKLVKSLLNKVSVHKCLRLLKNMAHDEEFLTTMAVDMKHGIDNEAVDKFRELCSYMTINIDHLSQASDQRSFHGSDDAVPLFWRFFTSEGSDFPPICNGMDVAELMKDSEELRSVIDEERTDVEGLIKEIILRLHLMLKIGFEVVTALASLPDIGERMMQMLRNVSEEENLYEMISETGFLDLITKIGKVKVEDVRRMCEFVLVALQEAPSASKHPILNMVLQIPAVRKFFLGTDVSSLIEQLVQGLDTKVEGIRNNTQGGNQQQVQLQQVLGTFRLVVQVVVRVLDTAQTLGFPRKMLEVPDLLRDVVDDSVSMEAVEQLVLCVFMDGIGMADDF